MYCTVLHGILIHLLSSTCNQSKQGTNRIGVLKKTPKKWELPQPLYTNFVFLLYLILFELINQQQNLIWNPCGLFCGCGFCGVVCGKLQNSWRGCFFSHYFHLLTFYHNMLTTEMVQSKWRSLARTGDGFFNKMGATWGQNIDIKKTGVQNINYKLKQLGAEYKVTSKILISILSM